MVVLSSSKPWDPNTVCFPKQDHSLGGHIHGLRHLSSVASTKGVIHSTPLAQHSHSPPPGDHSDGDNLYDYTPEDTIFNLSSIRRKIGSLHVTPKSDTEPFSMSMERPEVNAGTTDVPSVPTFQSTDRHTDVTPENLSERWHISLPQAILTLKKYHSALLA